MDDRDSMWFNRNEKLRAQSFFRRHFWKITTAGSLVLVLIFALLAFILLVKRPANGQVTAAPTNNNQVVSPQQATNTAQSSTNSSPTAVPTNTAAPASTPTPQLQGLPCTVNLGTWTDGSSDWKVLNGVLLDDGTNGNWDAGGGPTIVAPCDLGSTANYSVETKIHVTSSQNGACFGITVRGTPSSNGWQGYKAGVGDCYGGLDRARISGPDYHNDSQLKDASFNPGNNVHTYRIEVKDNTVKFFIDGGLVLSLIDNRYLSGSEVGLWCQNVQLSVISFQVTVL